MAEKEREFALAWPRSGGHAQPFASILTYPNGYVGSIPDIRTSKRGGWIYHPLEGTEKKPVTLGRAEVGRSKGNRLIQFLIEQTYEANDWETPIAATPLVSKDDADKSMGRDNGATIIFPVKSYGYVKLGISQQRARWNDNNEKWDFQMSIPTVILTSLARQIVSIREPATTVMVKVANKNDIEKISELIINDPLDGYASALLRHAEPMAEIKINSYNVGRESIEIPTVRIAGMLQKLKPIYPFEREHWTKAMDSYGSEAFCEKNVDGTNGPVKAEVSVSKSFLMASDEYRTVEIKQALLESADTLKVAFEALGVDVKILTARDRNLEGTYVNTIDGIQVRIPENLGGDQHNREGHTFTIRQSGVTVKCGYVDNEAKYIDDASRQALSDMKQLLEG